MSRRVPRVLMVLPAVALVAWGCTDDGEDDARVDPVVVTAPEGFDPDEFAGAEAFGLAMSGAEGCDDPTNDVGSSLVADTPPPVPQPHLDIVSTAALLPDTGEFTLSYTMAADIRDDVDAEFLVQAGTLDDPHGFDLSIKRRDGVWSLATEERAVGVGGSREIVRSARVTVTGAEVVVEVPASELPEFQPGQGVFFGVSGVIVAEDGTPIGRDGTPVALSSGELRAFDDCL